MVEPFGVDSVVIQQKPGELAARPAGHWKAMTCRTGLTGVFVVLLALQVFVPPFLGIANNGDFARVTGWFSLGPAVNGWRDNFLYFASRYKAAPEYSWRSGVYSSELIPAWIATRFRGDEWDIRWIGAVHALLLVGAFWLFVSETRSWWIGIAALLIFSDLSYAAYLNSFYMDTAAVLGLLIAAASARGLARGDWGLFTAGALLFVLSKPQHGIFGLIPAVLLLGMRKKAAAGLVICATLVSPWLAPAKQKQQSLFNLVFFKLAKAPADLAELGLDASDARYLGMNAYTPGAPGDDEQYLAGLQARSGYGAVMRFYLRHPLRALGLLRDDLVNEAWQIRPVNLRNFRREDEGRRLFQMTLWSRMRTGLFRIWPWHVVVWYAGAVVVGGCFALLGRRFEAGLLLGLVTLGLGEFVVCSWTDACETYRHLFIFHAVTDVTVLAVLFAVGEAPARLPALHARVRAPRSYFRPSARFSSLRRMVKS